MSLAGVYAGFIPAFLLGGAFENGLPLKMGQTHVQRDMPELLEHILAGRLKPEVVITHRMPLEKSPVGYRALDRKEEDCRKVMPVPGLA